MTSVTACRIQGRRHASKSATATPGEMRAGPGGDAPNGVKDKAFAAILLQLKQFPKPIIILKCILKHGRVCGLRKQYDRGAKSAMAMAIVAIPVALPLSPTG